MLYSGVIGRKSIIITVDPVIVKKRDTLQRYVTSIVHTLKKIKCKETQAQLVSLPLLFSSCQVVWRNSREIGAAWAIRKDKRLVISIKYHPGGNYVGYFKNNVFRPIATVLGPEWPHRPPGFTRCPAKFVKQTTTAVPTTTPTSVPNTTQITLPNTTQITLTNTTQITLPNTTQITVPTTSPSMCYTLQTTSAPLSQEKIQLKVNRGSSSDERFFSFILAVCCMKECLWLRGLFWQLAYWSCESSFKTRIKSFNRRQWKFFKCIFFSGVLFWLCKYVLARAKVQWWWEVVYHDHLHHHQHHPCLHQIIVITSLWSLFQVNMI